MNARIGSITAACALMLAGCGGGSKGDGGVPLTISGFAASGAAISGATVSLRCAFGTGTGTTGTDGTFAITMSSAVSPCLVQVTKGAATLHSFADGGGRINVTPLTDLAVARALGADPASVFGGSDNAKATGIGPALGDAKTYAATQFAALAGAMPSGDPINGPLAVGDANDKLLDAFAAALSLAGRSSADLRAAAAAGTSVRAALPAEESRPHDSIPYALSPAAAAATTFPAMAAAASDTVAMSSTSRYAGVLKGAGYRIEVPANWNGELVMYAHGYAGEGLVLGPVDTVIRRHLIQNGYAWATSSYSKNSYNVRAGIEDTNALALAFSGIVKAAGRTVAEPSKIYIMGDSMGGHIAAAAVEAETLATANNKVNYAGAVSTCGVVGDTELFNTIAGMQVSAQALAGFASAPVTDWVTDGGKLKTAVTSALFGAGFPSSPVSPNGAAGAAYFSVLQNLTGGPRPIFDLGYAYGGSYAGGSYANFGVTTVLTGLTTKVGNDTTRITYVVDGNAAASASLNASAQKLTAAADFNRLRRDGLRWIPKVNGQMTVPVITMHTLGDLFVPFSMQQVYRARANAAGNGDRLVQRAIRGATHCDFTNAERAKAFNDMIAWVKNGTKPAGDDVTTPATVAAATYGCTHTNNTVTDDDSGSTKALRGLIAQAAAKCPVN